MDRESAWGINSISNLSPSQPDQKEGSWKSFNTSMSAISFGFVATAILISMFIIMAIFEHLFKPSASHDDSRGMDAMDSMQLQKFRNPDMVSLSTTPDCYPSNTFQLAFYKFPGFIWFVLFNLYFPDVVVVPLIPFTH